MATTREFDGPMASLSGITKLRKIFQLPSAGSATPSIFVHSTFAAVECRLRRGPTRREIDLVDSIPTSLPQLRAPDQDS